MTDPLAAWWVHPITVERRTGQVHGGPAFAAPATIYGFVSDGTKLVAGPDGSQLASSAQVAFPPGTDYIPLQSRITLPAQFAASGTTRTTTVIAVTRADGGGQPTPDHLLISLL